MNRTITSLCIALVAMLFSAPVYAEEQINGYWLGDANGDSKVDIEDIAWVVNIIHTNDADIAINKAVDIIQDNVIDEQDLTEVIKIVLGLKEKTWVTITEDEPESNINNGNDPDTDNNDYIGGGTGGENGSGGEGGGWGNSNDPD